MVSVASVMAVVGLIIEMKEGCIKRRRTELRWSETLPQKVPTSLLDACGILAVIAQDVFMPSN
jgi:hypothetical protein